MITGDEKWIVCGNIERKRLWSKRDDPKHFKRVGASSKEDYVVNLVGLERHRVI